MSGAGSPYSVLNARNTETGRREISRTRNIGARSRNTTASVSRTRAKTPCRETTKTTVRTKIGTVRSPTRKKATCMKKPEIGKEKAVNLNQNSRLRVTRLAYSKNPTMNPIFSRLSKLNIETLASASKESNSIHPPKKQLSQESKVVDQTNRSSENSTENNGALQSIERTSIVDSNQKIRSSQDNLLKLNSKSATIQDTSKTSSTKQIISEPHIEEQTPPHISQTSMNSAVAQPQEVSSLQGQMFCEQNISGQTMMIRIPDQCVVHPIRVQAAMHQPSFSVHNTPMLRREVRECRPLVEPKNDEGLNSLIHHVNSMQPSTSSYVETNVVTIPSDTYAACQAAFSYAASSAAEALDNVLVQLQMSNTSEGGITHVSKVVVPGTSSRNMSSALAVLHSGSDSSVDTGSSASETSTSSTSSDSDPEWDDGPKVAEPDDEKGGRDREGSRSAGLSRPTLLWEVNDDDDKLEPPQEQ